MMEDVVRKRKSSDTKENREETSPGVHQQFQVTGVSFGGFSGQNKGSQEGLEWMQEQGENLAAMRSGKPDNKEENESGHMTEDMARKRNASDTKENREETSSGVHQQLQVKGVSFGGFSGQNKGPQEGLEWMQEQGKNLAAMGSEEPQSKDIKKEAAAVAAASLLPSYIATKAKEKIIEKISEAERKDKSEKTPENFKKNGIVKPDKSEIVKPDKSEIPEKKSHASPQKEDSTNQDNKTHHSRTGHSRLNQSSTNQGRHRQSVQREKQHRANQATCSISETFTVSNGTDSIWMQDSVKQRNVSREEMLKKCGINRASGYRDYVKKPTEETEGYLSEEDKGEEKEPMVCSREERKRRCDQKEVKEKNEKEKEKEKKKNSEKKKREKRKEKMRTRQAKKLMVRHFIIRQGMDPESQEMESGIGGLLKQLVFFDISRFATKISGKIAALFLAILSAILPVILGAMAIIVPIVLLVVLVVHPVSFFLGMLNGEEEILNHPKYVKTVVDSKYTDFYEDISDFANVVYKGGNKCNKVVYADLNRFNSGAVLAVYLSRICTDKEYSNMAERENKDGLPYFYVDSRKEEETLKEVFQQFNYTEVENFDTTVSYGVYNKETGKTTIVTEPVVAQKMTVHNLSLKSWKDKYLNTLSKEAKRTLKVLEEYAEDYINGAGDSDYGSITDIPIPEGSDQNLVYMAAFIKAEAGGEVYDGKVAVAHVILNRAGGPGGNIIGVLTAPGQFSCFDPTNKEKSTVEPYIVEYAQMPQEQREADDCWRAAAGAYTGAYASPIGDFRYYCNPKGVDIGEAAQWAKIRAKNGEGEIIVIGNHVFCKNGWW